MTTKTENDEILDSLTDEERAALEGDDGSGDQNDNDQGSGDGANDAGDDGAGGDGGDADAAGNGDDTGAADAAAGRDDGQADASGSDAEQSQGQTSQSAPLLVVEAPADADAKLSKIAEDKAALLSQFDEGDITTAEYQQKLDTLYKQEREIERAVDKAQIAAEMERQRAQNDWDSTCAAFLDANAQYKENPRLYRALDQEIRDIANSEAGKSLNGQQILDKAHANLAEAFGFSKAPAPKPGDPKPRVVPKPAVPPTLGKVPAAENNDTNGGRFANLDRLSTTNPLAYEDALMKLSDAERDAYLASA